MKVIKIIIVDDHFLVRVGLKSTLSAVNTEVQVEVVAEAATAKEFYQLMDSGVVADLVLLDIKLPDESGIEMAKKIVKEFPELKILMLFAENSPDTISKMMEVEIGGFISKGGSPNELFRAIESVVDGVELYGKDIARLMHNVRMAISEVADTKFTPKELDVLELSAQGLFAKEIASKLGMSPMTVGVHKSNIFKKLGIHSSVELVKYAIKMGFIKI